MIEHFNPKVINELRQLAQNNRPIVEMLEYLIKSLSLDEKSRLIVIAYLREAFSFKLSEVSQVGAWDFFEGGTWSIETIENEIKPLLKM